MKRRALLLSISDYDESLKLDYVRGDIPRLRRALVNAGFVYNDIKQFGPGSTPASNSPELSTSRIRKFTQQFLDSATPSEGIVIYFSGHGIEYDGRRYLVPQDYDPDRPESITRMITDGDLFAWARASSAAYVVYFLDTCREGVRLTLSADTETTKSIKVPGSIGSIVDASAAPSIAIVYSCERGQESRCSIGKECSAFTDTLAKVLEAEDDCATLSEILRAVKESLVISTRITQSPEIDERLINGRAGDPLHILIKESLSARFEARIESSEWAQGLRETSLWKTANLAPTVAKQAEAIAMRAQESAEKAHRCLPGQRWRHPQAPLRLIRCIDHFLLRAPSSPAAIPPLSPAEAGLILSVPFVYEEVLAAAEIRLSQEGSVIAMPTGADVSEESSPLWRAWCTANLADKSAFRQRQLLIDQGQETVAEDVAAWQLNNFCHATGEMWDAEGGAGQRLGWAADEVRSSVEPAPLRDVVSDNRIARLFTPERLLRFARLMFAALDDVVLESERQSSQPLRAEVAFGQANSQLTVNEIKIVHLLNIGARLALDPRRMPALLAEHIGSDPTMVLPEIQQLLNSAEWHKQKEALVLALTCPHEALDSALLSTIDELDDYRRRLLQRGDEHSNALSPYLPSGFTAADVEPIVVGGLAKYRRPHLRFSLDHSRIMDLLMGERLYGSPDMALRELYQNALDACRYRRAHEAYVRKVRNSPFNHNDYQGCITIRLGEERGRKYIECSDNGIGMADSQFRRIFALAGKRFADSHEFHLDKARWEAQNIPFYENSRFGIGVLSYFMLADEIEIESNRVEAHGPAYGNGIHARVLSSGSLFRIDKAMTGAVEQGGTRVRLYLKNLERPLREYFDSILGWLWIPEFKTLIISREGQPVELLPGEPAATFEGKLGPLIAIPEEDNGSRAPRFYWCLGGRVPYSPIRSAILLDGILIATDANLADNHVPGIAINFVEGLKIEVSVDRTRVLSATDGIRQASKTINTYGWRRLVEWKTPTVNALSILTARHGLAMSRLSSALKAGDLKWTSEPEGLDNKSSDTFMASRAGICDLDVFLHDETSGGRDRDYLSPLHGVSPVIDLVLASRLKELSEAGLLLPKNMQVLSQFACGRTMLSCPTPAGSILNLDIVEAASGFGSRISFDDIKITGSRLVLLADEWSASISDVVELARPLATFGIRAPDLERDWSSHPVVLTKLQRTLLSKDLDNRPPWREEIGCGCVVEAASKLTMGIEELLKIVRSLASLGVAAPVLELDRPELLFNLSSLESAIITKLPSKYESGSDARVWSALLATAREHRLHIREILQHTNVIQDLGLQLPGVYADDCQVDEDFLGHLLDGDETESIVERVGWHNILYAAKKQGKPLADAVDQTRLLQKLGVATVSLTGEKAELFVALSQNQQMLLEQSAPFGMITWPHIVHIGRKLSLPIGDVVEIAKPLSRLGTAVPFLEGTTNALALSKRCEPMLSRVYSDPVTNRSYLSCWDFVCVSNIIGLSLEELKPDLDAIATLGIDVSSCLELVSLA